MVAARLLPADPKDRQRIDRYELVGEIASGGMATVYLARRAGVGGFQRFVAVKRLHPHLANENEFVQMFLDEARLAALIHHPNVVSITEVGASDRGYYLVMDYIEGDTLARLMTDCAEAGRVVPLGVGLRIIIDMLAGLHAAHDLHDEHGNPIGLVHRDVSPQNVLVGHDGISRISDFGVARAASRLAGTRVGQLKGKIAYMAPEQAAGDELLDRRADVFAAGILLWELLTGRRLFRASNDAATLSRVVTEKIDPPIRFVEGLEQQISDVCMKALERPLSRRVASAAQFADMLESAATRAGVLVSGREVAAYMQSVLGEEVARQREAVRRWVSESDSVDENFEAGAGRRNSAGPPRDERIGFERLPNSSRTRPIRMRQVHDSDPRDLTLVARRPKSWLMGGALASLLLGATSVTWFLGSARAELPVAKEWNALPIPLFHRSLAVDHLAPQRGAHGDPKGSIDMTAGVMDAPGQVMLEVTDDRAAAAQPSASTRSARPNLPSPAASGRASSSPWISDVDLSNPYR